MLIGGEKMKGLKYTSLAVAALTATILASTNNGKVQAASTNENDTVTVAKSDQENAQAAVDSKKSALTDAQAKAKAPDNAYSAQQAKVNDSQKNLSAKQAIAKQAQDKLNSVTEISKKATPENIQKAQKSIAAQQDAIKNAKQNVSDANVDLNKAQAQLATAKQKQADAQNVVNAEQSAKQVADNNVAKAENDVKNSGLDEAKQNVEKVQNALNNIKKTNANNESILTTNKSALAENNQKIAAVNNNIVAANKSVTDAQNNVNAKQQALADAKKALKDLQDQVAKDQASGAAGFFKSIADNKDNSDSLREDARTAYNIITGQPNAYQDITVKWVKQAVELGQEQDSTSLSNIEKALGYYEHWMTYRDKYGLSHPSISLTAVAIAMLSSDFQHYSDEFNHPILLTAKYGPFYEDEEDISAGDVNPIDNWMSEKEDIDNYIKDHPDAAAYSFESSHPLTEDDWVRNVDFWSNKPVNIGHYTSMIKPDANYVGLAGNEYEIEPFMDNADSMDEIEFEQQQLDQANKNLAAVQAKVGAKAKALDDAKAAQAKASDALTQAQNVLAGATAAVKSAQTTVDNAQGNVNAKNKDLKAAQASLESLKQTLSSLENAKANLAAAQAALTTANNDVLTADKDVKAQELILSSLGEAKGKSDSQVASAEKDLEKAESDLANEQSKLAAAKAKLAELNKKANDNTSKSDSKTEINNQKPVKPVTKPGSEISNSEKPANKPELGVPGDNESDSRKEQSSADNVKSDIKSKAKSNKTKEEAKSSSSVKIVDNADSSTASVVLAGSNTAVKVYGEKTVNGTTYYKVEANRWVKADKAHVVSIGGQATTKHLPQTGAKNEIIAAISGLTVASVGIASAMGMSRKKKNN